MEDNNNPPKF